MKKISQVACAALTLLSGAASAQAQTVTSTPGTFYTTNGPITNDVLLSMMNGVRLTATFVDPSKNQTLYLANRGWTGTGFTLLPTLPTDLNTFLVQWRLENNTGSNLTGLTFDADTTRILFDRATNGAGTPGSDIGNDVDVCRRLLCVQGDVWNTTVNYTNEVGLTPTAPVGDLFRTVEITFNNGGISRDRFLADAVMFLDTDISGSEVKLPEPSSFALAGVGLLGLAAAARRRTRRA